MKLLHIVLIEKRSGHVVGKADGTFIRQLVRLLSEEMASSHAGRGEAVAEMGLGPQNESLRLRRGLADRNRVKRIGSQSERMPTGNRSMLAPCHAWQVSRNLSSINEGRQDSEIHASCLSRGKNMRTSAFRVANRAARSEAVWQRSIKLIDE